MNKKIKLLIVDDEERFLMTLARRLTLRDFEVVTVTNGTEALDLAAAQEFDLALVDLKMPGMGGDEVLNRLKQAHPWMEVIILTGHGSVESAVSCTQAGSYSYLQKPCETEELLKVLQAAFQKRLQRKMSFSDEKMERLARYWSQESALGILRRLKELDG